MYGQTAVFRRYIYLSALYLNKQLAVLTCLVFLLEAVPVCEVVQLVDANAVLGVVVLLPALIDLCGSGTTGCHGAFHSRLMVPEWRWDDDESARAWWSGELLAHGYPTNSPRLYELGRWVFAGPGGEAEVRL